MRGRVSFVRRIHGGKLFEPPLAVEPEQELVERGVAQLGRLDYELERARARYARAVAALDARSTELESLAQADEIIDTAMRAVLDDEDDADDRIPLGSATFEDLRSLGLSITQTRRVLRLRDDGVLTLTADLQRVPGLPEAELERLRTCVRD